MMWDACGLGLLWLLQVPTVTEMVFEPQNYRDNPISEVTEMVSDHMPN
jgi:hypothetical protein